MDPEFKKALDRFQKAIEVTDNALPNNREPRDRLLEKAFATYAFNEYLQMEATERLAKLINS